MWSIGRTQMNPWISNTLYCAWQPMWLENTSSSLMLCSPCWHHVQMEMNIQRSTMTYIHWQVKFNLVDSEIKLMDKSLDHIPPPLPNKSCGSPLYHRPIVESMSFLCLPFLQQALGTGGLEWFDKFVWCPLVQWSLDKHEFLNWFDCFLPLVL